MGPFDELVRANARYVAAGEHRALPVRPARRLAVLTCMDCRIAAFPTLGLDLGDAHVIRGAGARVTDDVLRSLALSTHALGTRAVVVVGHTDCGLYDPDGTLTERLAVTMGHPPEDRDWYAFDDPRQAVADDCQRLLTWPDRPDGFMLAGYLLDIEEGRLLEVVAPTEAPPP